MKIFRFVPIAAALALVVSCEKPQSEADRNAEVERKVQERLTAERLADEQQRLAQQAADLEAREKALAAKKTDDNDDTRATSAATPRTTPRATASRASTASSAKSAPRGYETFYRKLEPHGAWRESADYGYVWQPRVAQRSRDWRPYTDGRWAHTDAGWTWVSDEPFGWATYHYGRWTRLGGVGWVWVPGDEWAPAWVSWRKSDDHVGWAPLPPEARFERNKGIKKWADSYYDIDADEYVFIPNEYIGDDHLERHALPAERNVTIVQQTTNVTNITYNNTVIVNEGPNYEELRSRSRQPLQQYRLEREYEVAETESPRARLQGNTLALIAPIFAARASERPRTEGTLIQRATAVERAPASGVDPAERERARTKMRAEATAPPDAPSKRYEKPVVEESAPAATPAATAPTATATPSGAETVLDASPTASPRATVTATATATATAAATASPSPAPTRRPLTTPTPTPATTATATPTPTAAASATPSPTPRATATPTPAPSATATPTPTPTATPTATATPTPTPRATATATPIATATATPAATATATPVSTPVPVATPRATLTPAATVAPTATPVASPSDEETPDTEGSPVARGVRGMDPRQEKARLRTEEMRREVERRNASLLGTGEASPTPAAIAPARGVTPPPTAATPSSASAAAEDRTSIPKSRQGAPTAPAAQASPAESSDEEAGSGDEAVAPGERGAARREQRLRERAARMLGASPSPSPTPEGAAP